MTLRPEGQGRPTLGEHLVDSIIKKGISLDGGGLGSVVPGTIHVNQRREVE